MKGIDIKYHKSALQKSILKIAIQKQIDILILFLLFSLNRLTFFWSPNHNIQHFQENTCQILIGIDKMLFPSMIKEGISFQGSTW